jgi:hypothetical protein
MAGKEWCGGAGMLECTRNLAEVAESGWITQDEKGGWGIDSFEFGKSLGREQWTGMGGDRFPVGEEKVRPEGGWEITLGRGCCIR